MRKKSNITIGKRFTIQRNWKIESAKEIQKRKNNWQRHPPAPPPQDQCWKTWCPYESVTRLQHWSWGKGEKGGAVANILWQKQLRALQYSFHPQYPRGLSVGIGKATCQKQLQHWTWGWGRDLLRGCNIFSFYCLTCRFQFGNESRCN